MSALHRCLLSALLILTANAANATADRYVFDKDHTHLIFFISHLGFSNTIGRIRDYDGYFTFDESNPTASEIDVTLKPASVDTSVSILDEQLRGPKFFNVKQYPTMHFKSTHVTVTGKNTGDIEGNLTLLGVTKPITLHVVFNKSGIDPFTNNYTAGFSADTTFRRSDFGMNSYPSAVGDEVKVHMEVEATDPLKHPGNVKTPH